MKLGLGTAQFGLDYGVSNSAGRTGQEQVEAILARAAEDGVRVLDTAPSYGIAEEVLGRAGVTGFRVITKTVPGETAEQVRRTLERSLARLGLDRAHGLIVHRADDLLGAPDADERFAAMAAARGQGLVERVGASVYSPQQARDIAVRFDVDLIQLPLNVLDQRAIADGTLGALREAGVEVHARSAFLQGLLLMDPRAVPAYFDPWRTTIAAFAEWADRSAGGRLGAALGFAAGVKEISTVIVGVNDVQQFEQLLGVYRELDGDEFARFACADEDLVDPSRWEA